MIRPGGFQGAAFGTALEGNARDDIRQRRRMSQKLGISSDWAWANQVHGASVIDAVFPGSGGEADVLVTSVPGLPLAIATADCVPVILEGTGVAAVLHAGWRGIVAGVVSSALEHLQDLGVSPLRAAIGPSIGPCCYEVGDEVADHFPKHASKTRWGTPSVDLAEAISAKLSPLKIWRSDVCTFTSRRLHSYRRNRSMERQVTVTWIPVVSKP